MFITNIATKGVKMYITMSEDTTDVKEEVEESSTETNEETEAQAEETSQETSEKEESKAVPYSRFKEVNDELKRLKEEAEAEEETKVETKAKETPDVDSIVEQKLTERDLKAMELPEKVETEVRDYLDYKRSKGESISVQEAAQAPHIQTLKEEVEQEERLHKGAASSTSKGKSVKNVDPDNPPDFDLSTEEGQKGWEEWKKAANEKLQN